MSNSPRNPGYRSDFIRYRLETVRYLNPVPTRKRVYTKNFNTAYLKWNLYDSSLDLLYNMMIYNIFICIRVEDVFSESEIEEEMQLDLESMF